MARKVENLNEGSTKEWKGNHAFKRSITHWMEIPKLPE